MNAKIHDFFQNPSHDYITIWGRIKNNLGLIKKPSNEGFSTNIINFNVRVLARLLELSVDQ
jgi:hypothetical protein